MESLSTHQKHHRHVTFDVNTPPSSGPAIEARPNVAAMKPVYFGRFSSGRISARITFAPVMPPALPMPATARPMMNAVDVGAAAQTIDPISKIRTVARNAHFAGKNVCLYVNCLGRDGCSA